MPTTADAVDLAIASSFLDFEDAVQHFTALEGGAEVIITRNPSDFIPHNIIPVLTPREFLDKYIT